MDCCPGYARRQPGQGQVRQLGELGALMSVVSVETRDNLAIVTIDNPPVNALSQAVRAGIVRALDEAEGAGAEAVVLCCAGRTFVAGADIREFGKPPKPPWLPEVFERIEACGPAGGGRAPRHDARRGVGTRAGLSLPNCRADRPCRVPGGPPRTDSGRRRHPAAAATGGCGTRPGHDDFRQAGECRRGGRDGHRRSARRERKPPRRSHELRAGTGCRVASLHGLSGICPCNQ